MAKLSFKQSAVGFAKKLSSDYPDIRTGSSPVKEASVYVSPASAELLYHPLSKQDAPELSDSVYTYLEEKALSLGGDTSCRIHFALDLPLSKQPVIKEMFVSRVTKEQKAVTFLIERARAETILYSGLGALSLLLCFVFSLFSPTFFLCSLFGAFSALSLIEASRAWIRRCRGVSRSVFLSRFAQAKLAFTAHTTLPVTGTPLSVTVNDVTLNGTVFAPSDRRRHQTILLFAEHSTDEIQDVAPLYDKLSGSDLTVVRFDYAHPEGKALLTPLSMKEQVQFACAVIDRIKLLDSVDSYRIGIFGCGFGSIIASLAAAERQKDIHKLILWSPALHALHKSEQVLLQQSMRIFPDPVLIVSGRNDASFGQDETTVYVNGYRDCEAVVVENAGHVFHDAAFDYAFTITLRFIR